MCIAPWMHLIFIMRRRRQRRLRGTMILSVIDRRQVSVTFALLPSIIIKVCKNFRNSTFVLSFYIFYNAFLSTEAVYETWKHWSAIYEILILYSVKKSKISGTNAALTCFALMKNISSALLDMISRGWNFFRELYYTYRSSEIYFCVCVVKSSLLLFKYIFYDLNSLSSAIKILQNV